MGVRANLRIRVKPVHFRDPIQSLLMGFSSPESSNKFKRKHLKNTVGKAWYVCVSMRVSILTFHYIVFCLIGRMRKRKRGKLWIFINFDAFGFKLITNSSHFFWCIWGEEFSFYLGSQLTRFVHLEVLLNLLTMIAFFFFWGKMYIGLTCLHKP